MHYLSCVYRNWIMDLTRVYFRFKGNGKIEKDFFLSKNSRNTFVIFEDNSVKNGKKFLEEEALKKCVVHNDSQGILIVTHILNRIFCEHTDNNLYSLTNLFFSC